MNEVVYGLDFGTSNTCISYFDPDSHQIKVIPDLDGYFTVPTCIEISKSENGFSYTFGRMCQNVASISNVKRLIGMSWEQYKKNIDLQNFFKSKNLKVVQDFTNINQVAIQVDTSVFSTVVTLEQLIGNFLDHVLKTAQQFTCSNSRAIVLTVPAYFSNVQRNILRNICSNYNIHVLRIINEPTAAALAYVYQSKMININQPQSNPEETIIVIDCGGGTTDISVLNMDCQNDIYEVIDVNGDNFLGGEDLTQGLLKFACDKVITYHQFHKFSDRQLERLRKACEKCKCELSYKQKSNIMIDAFSGDLDINIEITRKQFIQCNEDYFNKIKKLLRDSITGKHICKVIFVGGCSRIPFLETLCNQLIGNVSILKTLDPDHTVSIGASYQGYLINNDSVNNKDDVTIIDVLNMSVGIELEDGLMYIIVSKNTPIPVTKNHVFTNCEDYIGEVTINVYQGNRLFVRDNHFLGQITLSGLDTTLKHGEMYINVEFDIDSNGILKVFVRDTKTKSVCKLVIHNKVNNLQQTDNYICQDTSTSDNDEFDLLLKDSSLANQTLAKKELQKTYDRLHLVFLQNKEHAGLRQDTTEKLLNLFSFIEYVLSNYTNFNQDKLQSITKDFIEEFHLHFISDLD